MVECLPVDPASWVRFPAGTGKIFSLYDNYISYLAGYCNNNFHIGSYGRKFSFTAMPECSYFWHKFSHAAIAVIENLDFQKLRIISSNCIFALTWYIEKRNYFDNFIYLGSI